MLMVIFFGWKQPEVNAQTIFNYTNASNGAPAFVAPNVTGGPLTRGVGVSGASLSCVGATDGFGADGWPSTNTFDVNAFNSSGDFITFSLVPTGGFGMKITGFSARSRRENVTGTDNDGPIALRYGYSTDGINWTTVNPGNPQSSNICASSGVLRAWPSFVTVNASSTVIFRIYGLSSGILGTGDLVLHDVIVSGDVCASTPSISPAPTAFALCRGTTSVNYNYMTKAGDTYSIDYNAAANLAGFVDVASTNLPTGPGTIGLVVPAAVAANTYNGTFTVHNVCGFITNYNFTITVNPLPVMTCPANQSVCIYSPAFALSGGMPGGGTYTGTGVNAGMFDPAVAGVGVHPVTYSYTDGNGCSNSCTFNVTVNAVTATANAGADQMTCVDGIVQVSGTIMGSPGTGVWTSSVGGGTFSNSAALATYYTPPSGYNMPIVLTLTPDGLCPVSDDLTVTYGPLPPLTLQTNFVPSEATCGDIVVVNIVAANGFNAISSLQYGVSWNDLELQYMAPPVAPSIGGDPPGVASFSSNAMNYLWIDSGTTGENLPDGTVLLTLTFKVISSSGLSTVSITNLGGYSPIEATNAQFCQLTVDVSGADLTINPIVVTCPNSQTVCVNDAAFLLSGASPAGGTYTGPGVSANTFNPAIAGVDTHTITYSYTNNDGCSNECTFDITVNPLPNATITVSSSEVCPGTEVVFTFNETNWPQGTEFTVTADVSPDVDMQSSLTFTNVVNGDDVHLTEGVNFTGTLTVSNIMVTESQSGCSVPSNGLSVVVFPAPSFEFTATTTSGGSDTDNNNAGPSTITVNFCAGDHLTLSGYSDNGNIGYLGSYTTSGNVTYDGGGIGVGPVVSTVSPSTAATFFGTIYGGTQGYGLSAGTFGTITQVFTPFLDANGNDTYDLGIDCLGDPITLQYNIYAPISLTITRNNDNQICSGDAINYSIATTSSQNVVFDLVVEAIPNGANPADLTDDNTLPLTIPGLIVNNAGSTPYTQAINNAVGTFDRGRVQVRATNIHYQDAIVCGPVVDVSSPNTRIYPKPILTNPGNLSILSGSTVNLNFDPLSGTPSLDIPSAGYPVRIDWTAVATGGVTGFTPSGSTIIYDQNGMLNAVNDISETLTLPAATCTGSVTYTITPVSDGPNPGGGFDANFCTGDPFDVVVKLRHPMVLTSSVVGSSQVACGDNVTIQVTASGFCNVGSLDYGFTWDDTHFQLVTQSTPYVTPDGTFVTFQPVSNELYLEFFDNDYGDGGTTIPDGSVIMTYTLQAIGASGTYNVPDLILEESSDIDFEDIPVSSTGVSIEIVPLSLLSVGPVQAVCPNDPFAILPFSGVVGNPNQYVITYDAAAQMVGFPPMVTGTLDLMTGNIVLVVPPGLMHGVYHGTLVVSNSATGCSSTGYPISITVDQTPPTASSPAPISQACMPAPAPNPLVVIDEMDNCPGPLAVTWLSDVSNGGTGCGVSPKIITRSYQVTDVAGNTTVVTQTITMLDNVAPTVSTAGMAVWYPDEASAIAAAMAIANATKHDNCTPPNGITVTQGTVPTYVGCGVTIHLIVADACGNIASVNYTTIIDSEAPTADVLAIDDCYEESDDPQNPFQYAINAAIAATIGNDDCTDPQDLVYTAVASGSHCALEIAVTVTDACGKNITVYFTTRVDSKAPIISALPDALSIEHGLCFETVEDAEAAAVAETMAHTGDDCGAAADLQYDVFTSMGCPAEIMVVVTDYCGNPSFITYTDVHIDNEAPTVFSDEGYATCFQTEAAAFETLIAASHPEDNCSSYDELVESADPVFVPSTPNDACNDGTVTITFTDRCGHSATIEFTDIVIDNVPPTLVSLPVVDPNYTCIDDVPMPVEQAVVGADNCSEFVVATWIEDIQPTSCPGTLTRIYRLTDNCGNTTDVMQEIMVNDNIAPTWITDAGSLDRTYACDDEQVSDAFLEEPEAQDNCGEVTLVKTTGLFVPSEKCAQEGTYTNTWTVSDQCGNTAATSFTQVISVIDNTPPVVEFACQFMPPLLLTTEGGAVCPAEANISLQVGEYVNPTQNWLVAGVVIPNLEGCVTDNCSALTEIKVTLVQVDYAENESFPAGCSKLITASFQISDACGNANPDLFVCQYLIVDNTAPVWSTLEGAPYPMGIDAALSCSDVNAYAFANGLAPVATDNCPGGVTIVKEQGVFVPGGNCPSEGTITNTFVAYDACGDNNPSVVFTQTISLFDNEPPVFNPNCQQNLDLYTQDGADCPLDADITLQVGDVFDNNYTWSVAGLQMQPFGTCVEDNCSDASLIKIHVTAIENVYDPVKCFRTITVHFQFEDACGNIQQAPFTDVYRIKDNTAPLVFCAQKPNTGGPQLQSCYHTVAAAEADALASIFPCDNCTAPEDLIISVSTVGTCSAAVTVTVKDCAGNSTSYIFNTRIDGTGPTLTQGTIPSCFPTLTLAEAAAMAATGRVDNCPGGLSISASTVGTCPATITVTVTDGCGNSSSVVYGNICIGSGNSVTITTQASNQTVNCSNEVNGLAAWLANHGGAVATGSGVVWTYSPMPIVFGAINCMTHSKSVTVTFTATDNCGYTAQSTATFSVQDLTPPTANAVATTNLTCNSNIPAPSLSLVTGVNDNCDPSPTVALFSNTSNGGSGCPNSPLILLRTYSVTDKYCNTTYVTHTINIVDNIAPTFTAPGNITINVNAGCSYDASPAVTGDVTNEQDNCSTGLNATYNDAVAIGNQFQVKYIITRTWKLVDNCGNSATPLTQIITVKDVTPPTITCPNALYMPGGVVENNSCAWMASGLTPTFADNCNGAAISYSLSGFFSGNSTGVGTVDGRVFLEGETTVTYTVTDAVGNTATCSFVVTVNCTTISGRIIWEHDKSTGVKDATVRLTFGMLNLGSTLSDVGGNYTLPTNVLGMHTITPVKNINRLNGVTAADATAIQQHISGATLITDPYKKVAADVNRSGFITSQDANLITQCLAGNPTALAVFNVFWRFVPTSFPMPATPPTSVPAFPESITLNVTGPDITGQDFYGMKIGDVNGSANPALAPTGTPLVWMLKDQNLQAGTEVELNFAATNFTNLAAVQFALDFDPTYLQFVGFKSLDAIPLTSDNFGDFQANLGELRFVWSQAQGLTLADGTPVMKATFKVLKGGKQLSSVIQLDDSALPCKAFTESLVASEVRVVFAESVAASDPVNPGKPQLQLFQNQPNPFAGATMIGFVLPEACDAQLRVMDVSGRELSNYKRTYTAGYHEIEFKMENAAAYGVLYYELITPFGSLTKKMVTAK